jgi:hypothetical protein
MRVDKLSATNAQDHRAVALDQRLERHFSDLTAGARKLLQQLPVGKLPNRSDVEERFELA